MTTITRFTKEQLQEIIETDHVQCGEASALARIALASIEAKPVAWIVHSRGGDQLTTDANYVANAEGMGGIHSTPVYAAPPAPVLPEIDRNAIADRVYGKCCRIPGSTFYNAAEFAIDEVEACRAAMLQRKSDDGVGSWENHKNTPTIEPVSNRDELREKVRREHAEWSDKTFGNVGPVGPLKHLSKEALEAAADPSDSLEWADMQFLLWDAQRRMGLSDDFITRAMIEKLAINKTRQWPEPKDGEPRLHIKSDQRQEHM